MLVLIKKSPCSGHIGSAEVSVCTIVLVSGILSCKNHEGITALAGDFLLILVRKGLNFGNIGISAE